VPVRTHTEELAGWGNYPRALCDVSAPAYPDDVAAHIDKGGTLARGMGRSYGDACYNDQGRTLDIRGLNRFHAFDADTGALTCEAGVTLGQIIEQFAPRGWFPMITPGTKLVTVGGCIGNDVHGKAHHADGCFSKCVESFTILLADGRVLTCSREENDDLFWANFGGMGLLGVILTATIKLRRIETTYFRQESIKAGDLDEMMAAIDETNERYPYAVAWVDTLATGDRLGRGVLTVGDHATFDDLPAKLQRDPLALASAAKVPVPVFLPNQTLNQMTLRALNKAFEQVLSRGGDIAHYEGFFYPLDAFLTWNKAYGTRGFTQYQFVVPLEDGHAKVRALLEEISGSGFLPFLNVLKRFGPEEGILSFPFEGYTYAIDFPIQDGLGDFLKRLDDMVYAFGGRIYLGKDAFLSAEMFEAMYPRLPEWKAIKAKYDPENVFTSNLGRRVGLVP
jgi:decaprenylphospho-beta-D-ribofuranose 2-oxidase